MIYQILGFILILTGGFHLIDPSDQLESRIVRSIQKLTAHQALLTMFQEVWFLGRTTFALVILLLLVCADWKAGLAAVVSFSVIVGIEQLIKNSFERSRPFQNAEDIHMLQPREPIDPSFPSGDALRIWYLALIIPVYAESSLAFTLAAIGLALLVTLGRMAMGVHYLTDTLAGAGLGLLGAGTTIWLWFYFCL